MRKQALWVLFGVMCCGTSVMAAAVALDHRPASGAKQTDARPSNDVAVLSDSDAVVSGSVAPVIPADLEIGQLDTDTVFEHVVVGADGVASVVDDGATAVAGERLIYSNTLGINTIRFGNGQLVSDDITTTAPVGCNLTKFSFRVLGRVVSTDPIPPGTPYTVRYSLYTTCPQAVTPAQRAHYTDEALPNTGIKIRGTDGEITFPDDAPRIVTHEISFPTVVELPTNVWLGISFTRSNCGAVVGAPAAVGHSPDNMDFTGTLACNAYLGGFPAQPHASFWAEMYGDANCPESFVAYKAAKASGAQFSAGRNIMFLDDVKLVVDDCQMIGYEVAVRSQGFYQFELMRDCGGGAGIPGTYKTFIVNLSTQPQLQLARFAFDPPIPLNTGEPLFFRFIVNSDTAGVVLAGMAPTIGSSTEDYFLVNTTGGCDPVPPAPGSPVSGVFHASITCGGAQPLGACCDPYLTQCAGGADDGKRCKSDAECAAPGTCGAVCRQTALINCPFPSGGQDLDPKWKEGAACSPEPYPNTPCGISSCCHLTFNLITSDPRDLREACVNMTKSECDAVPPLKKCAGGSSNGKSCEVAQDCPSGACEPAARLWQLGSYCSLGAQTCPRNACLARAGSCYSTHNTPGCSDPFCCTKVCTNFGAVGAYCCDIEWDQGCVDLAQVDPSDGGCANPPGNNECAPNVQRGIDGATTIPVPGSVPTDNRKATTSANEPGFCCHGGVGTCVGDPFNGEGCVEQVECSPGFCTSMTPSPGKQGVGTVWFKFVQPNGFTSARINTCTSNSPALDSLVQAFKVGDNTTPDSACRSLSVIGCNDDTPGCSSSGRNSDLCLQNLVPGETYYIALAAKTKSTRGQYRVAVSAGCNPSSGVLPNDYCPAASTITDGETPFFINVNVCIGGSKAGQVCTVPADCPNGGNCTEDRKQATIDCPAESCIAGGLNDVWYNYTATCTGTARFDTCGTDPAPDTNLAVYADCTKCPPVSDEPVCNGDCFLQGCGLGSCVNVDVQQGQCYKVRLSDNQGFPVSGKLTVTCLGNDCQPNGIPDDVDIANCPPNDPDCQDCNGNLKPDECDIRDGLDTDCNLNGVPDFCELATRDCQPNGIPDDCDITSGTSLDVSPADGIPDECQNDCSTDPATSVPPNCAIDARQPHVPGDPGTLQGWSSVAMTFPAGCNVAGAVSGDFTVEVVPAGAAPTVSGVGVAGQVVTVTLSGVIPAQKWTCITHTATTKTVCLGSLPADANGDRTAAPVDILDIIDNLNGVLVPPLAVHQCDIDRSALCAPADILSEIDLLNGASGFLVWNGKTLPVCPSAP